MIYLRSIFFYLGEALSTIPFFFISMFATLFPAKTRSRLIAGWAVFITWWLKVTCKLDHQLIGAENIPTTPCVFACSHSSTWETITTQTFLPPVAWVLKKELLQIPFFGWGLWASGPIAIDRSDKSNALEQVVKQGKQKIAEGRHVLIYPEGTRTRYGEVGRYKKGAATLALATNSMVVPIAHDAGKYWQRDSWWIKSGTIRCIIGPAIHTEGKTHDAITAEIKAWILSQQL